MTIAICWSLRLTALFAVEENLEQRLDALRDVKTRLETLLTRLKSKKRMENQVNKVLSPGPAPKGKAAGEEHSLTSWDPA